MPHSPKFPKSTLQHLARHVGEKLSAQATNVIFQGGKVEIAETFEIWFLGRTAVLRPEAPLSQLAHRTGHWYHQIRHDGQAQEYAVSQTYGPGARDWQVHAVMKSSLPPLIDKAIAWIDHEEINGDPLVRLINSPAYRLWAFWLVAADGPDNVVIVSEPEWFNYLHKEQLYNERDFLTFLAREQPARALPRR
jgi:hypothetical protein